MTKKIRVAIAGVGNCASALVQGIYYYNSVNEKDCIGLTAYDLNGYTPIDIEFVAAFDVSDSKVGLDLSEAIFSNPNNAIKITNVNNLDV
ncbi:MAG: inositol-3-phosphate synthase, partial [Nitrososphaeraceae archaeon]